MSLLASTKTSAETDELGPHDARRFFHSSALWDPAMRTVVLRDGGLGSSLRMGSLGVNGVSQSHPNAIPEIDLGLEMDGISHEGNEWTDADAAISVES